MLQQSNKKDVKAKSKRARVSNRVTIDPRNPIPFGNDFVFSFANQTTYLPFLPPKDSFAQDLLEARLLSVTNFACISTKKDYCAGEGFQDKGGKTIDQRILDWFKCMNRRNESVTEINQNIFEDDFTYGNTPIELVRTTVAGKKYLFIYVHSFLEWRLGRPNDDDYVDYAVQSKLFLKKGYPMTSDVLKKSKRLPIYNPLDTEKNNWQKDKDDKTIERTLIWYRNRVSGFPYYGIPSNIAALIYELLEYKGARFNLDNFDNNMVASAILALKGSHTEQEADRIGKRVVNTHTGDGKHGRVIVVSSEEGIEGSDYHQMDTKREGSYTEADNKWEQKIILANQWDAILAGIISPSTLGKGAGFITKILEIKLKSVIKPAQQDLFNKVWVDIFKIAEEWLGLKFSEYDLEFKNSIDISGLTDIDITPAVTRNEVRQAKGLPEDKTEEGKKYMKSTGPVATKKEEGGGDV